MYIVHVFLIFKKLQIVKYQNFKLNVFLNTK